MCTQEDYYGYPNQSNLSQGYKQNECKFPRQEQEEFAIQSDEPFQHTYQYEEEKIMALVELALSKIDERLSQHHLSDQKRIEYLIVEEVVVVAPAIVEDEEVVDLLEHKASLLESLEEERRCLLLSSPSAATFDLQWEWLSAAMLLISSKTKLSTATDDLPISSNFGLQLSFLPHSLLGPGWDCLEEAQIESLCLCLAF
ncbi:hypothetical protein L1987_70976 [Smallanthus sonchifolius]|uniref:Uncharacterized protein n=1 Tax=Smallanthus sonchifolius TaxID=185202 RepID=A0ACB9AVG1_9ASTR|nr:hypothetical protein L1987_70976 [Smallanthus sonchifolius]